MGRARGNPAGRVPSSRSRPPQSRSSHRVGPPPAVWESGHLRTRGDPWDDGRWRRNPVGGARGPRRRRASSRRARTHVGPAEGPTRDLESRHRESDAYLIAVSTRRSRPETRIAAITLTGVVVVLGRALVDYFLLR